MAGGIVLIVFHSRLCRVRCCFDADIDLFPPLLLQYNTKERIGRGFSLAELKEAGISKKVARSIGIAVDHRRTNLSAENLKKNIDRLLEYKSKLVVIPRRSNQRPKAGDSGPEQTSNAPEAMITPLPLQKASSKLEFVDVPEVEGSVYSNLRKARTDAKLVGIRKKMKEEKEEK